MPSSHHLDVGNAYAGWRVVLLLNGLDVQILGLSRHTWRPRQCQAHIAPPEGFEPSHTV